LVVANALGEAALRPRGSAVGGHHLVTRGDTMPRKRKKNPPQPVDKDELSSVIERAVAGKVDLTDAQIATLVNGLKPYIEQVVERAYDAGYDQAKDE